MGAGRQTPARARQHQSRVSARLAPCRAEPDETRFVSQLHQALRSRYCSRRTEKTHCHRVKRFIRFHNVRYPAGVAEPESNAILAHLALQEKASTSTQNEALSALLFLYRRIPRRGRTHTLRTGGCMCCSDGQALDGCLTSR